MKDKARELIAKLKDAGFKYQYTDGKGWLHYEHKDGRSTYVSPSGCGKSERAVARVLAGVKGRRGDGVKSRVQRKRDLERERIAREKEQAEQQRAEYLARIAGAPFLKTDREALQAIEKRLAELRRLEHLMRRAPGTSEHQGHRKVRQIAG